MTPRFLLAALAAVLPVAAMSQGTAPAIETVIVNGGTLAGIWKLTYPNYIGKAGIFAPLIWGPMRDRYCRIEQGQDLKILCFGAFDDIFKQGVVTTAGGHIHLAWGTMMARVVIDGALQSPTQFTGTYAIKLSGLSFDDPEPSTAIKLSTALPTPDTTGKSPLMQTILANGMDAVPHDDAAIAKNSAAFAGVGPLGALQTIAYLGQLPRQYPGPPGTTPRPDFTFSLFAAEFEGGERICGLHQRDDGVIDAFLCI